jgi:hypothetical protein
MEGLVVVVVGVVVVGEDVWVVVDILLLDECALGGKIVELVFTFVVAILGCLPGVIAADVVVVGLLVVEETVLGLVVVVDAVHRGAGVVVVGVEVDAVDAVDAEDRRCAERAVGVTCCCIYRCCCC